jgi:hypothetical protein
MSTPLLDIQTHPLELDVILANVVQTWSRRSLPRRGRQLSRRADAQKGLLSHNLTSRDDQDVDASTFDIPCSMKLHIHVPKSSKGLKEGWLHHLMKDPHRCYCSELIQPRKERIVWRMASSSDGGPPHIVIAQSLLFSLVI